jgi:hypothetical protein
LIARLYLNLNIGEQPACEDNIRTSHNHNYKHVSRQTTTRDLEALFYLHQSNVKELLETSELVSCMSMGRYDCQYVYVSLCLIVYVSCVSMCVVSILFVCLFLSSILNF